jgi:hypothetical protein
MGLFGKLVATAVNVATLPVSVAKDVVTLGGAARGGSYTAEKLEKLVRDAQ